MIPGIMPVIAAGAERDPHFANVTLLMHMDGANSGTVFTDSSSYGVTPARAGNTVTSTAQKKFGESSAYFDGSGDNLSIPYTTAKFRWWDAPFTIELWARFSALPAWAFPSMMSHGNGAGTTYWSFGPTSTGALRWYYFNGAASDVITGSGIIVTNTWHHIAMTQTAGTVYLFIDGILQQTGAYVGTPQDSAALSLFIGRAHSADFGGYIDDLRITKGVARYTSSFTPPGQAFPDS